MIVIGCQQDWTANSLKLVDKIPNDKLSQPSIYNFKLVLKLNLLRHHHHQHQDNTKSSWSAWSSSGIKLPRYSWEFKLVSNYRGTHGAGRPSEDKPTNQRWIGFVKIDIWISLCYSKMNLPTIVEPLEPTIGRQTNQAKMNWWCWLWCDQRQ